MRIKRDQLDCCHAFEATCSVLNRMSGLLEKLRFNAIYSDFKFVVMFASSLAGRLCLLRSGVDFDKRQPLCRAYE